MQSGTRIESLRRRRRRDRNALIAGPKIVTGIAVVTIGCIWTIGVAFFSFTLAGREPQRHLYTILKDFPRYTVNLWPDDAKNKVFRDKLKECIPSEAGTTEGKCQQITSAGSSQRIGILRPPGIFGLIMEKFVKEHVEIHDTEKKIKLLATSHIDTQQHSFTKIIRVATLPVLLEAVDLVFETTASNDFAPENVTFEDLVGVVRLLVRWHCRLSQIAENTALLTITLASSMSHPPAAEAILGRFLEFDEEDNARRIEMDDLAHPALLRIDASTALVSRLQAKMGSSFDVEERINQVIAEEMEYESCQPTETLRKSRATEIVGHFLDPNPESSTKICKKYPKISMCDTLKTT